MSSCKGYLNYPLARGRCRAAKGGSSILTWNDARSFRANRERDTYACPARAERKSFTRPDEAAYVTLRAGLFSRSVFLSDGSVQSRDRERDRS